MNRCTPQLINSQWLAHFERCNKLIVGFSGGLDSTVLLHALASHSLLHKKIVAVHINHGISPHAFVWQTHCEQFCHRLGTDFIVEAVQFDRSANIEERARIARYAVFSSLLTEQDCLILGHHQDDQAETVLLQLFRGAGIDGLAAMSESGYLGLSTLARPLLPYSRAQLEEYAALHQLVWIEDESNQDTAYARNYLRQNIIPLLVEKWPGVVGNIARTARHCQHAKSNLEALAVSDISSEQAMREAMPTNALFIEPLLRLNYERRVNILRVWLRNNKVRLPSTITFQRLIHEMIDARVDAVPEIRWGEVLVRRYQKYLFVESQKTISLPLSTEWLDFPSPLIIEKTGIILSAQKTKQGLVIPQGAKIFIRFRQGGEEFFWRGQTKQLKKLLQEWRIPPWLREYTPLLYLDETLAAVIGYAVSDLFFKKNSTQSWSFFSKKMLGSSL